MTGHVIVLKQRPLNRKRGWTTTFLTLEVDELCSTRANVHEVRITHVRAAGQHQLTKVNYIVANHI